MPQQFNDYWLFIGWDSRYLLRHSVNSGMTVYCWWLCSNKNFNNPRGVEHYKHSQNRNKLSLSSDEYKRYSRHLLLSEIGREGQEKLKAAKVLVIGAGGLGCPALLYLTAAGVGTIGIIDHDTVDFSNLQRQVLYKESDIGQPKVTCAKAHLSAQNPFINISTFETQLTSRNALEIIADFDFVIDGSDNFATRYLVNDACVMLDKPFIYGAIHRFSGQIAVFNYQNGPTYRCLFPEPPLPGEVPSCSEAGVLGVLPGIIGSFQATEAIKMITEIGEVASGKLVLIDTLTLEFNKLNIKKVEKNNQIDKLIDYEAFCGAVNPENDIQEMSPAEFRKLMEEEKRFQLIDVRESLEYNNYNIGGKLIPLKELESRLSEISREQMVVVHCQSGGRSKKAVEILRKHGFEDVFNLTGGLVNF